MHATDTPQPDSNAATVDYLLADHRVIRGSDLPHEPDLDAINQLLAGVALDDEGSHE